MNLTVVLVRLIAGGAMFDKTGSHWSGVGCKVPEMIRMVSLSCLSTSLVWEERPQAGTQLAYSATE